MMIALFLDSSEKNLTVGLSVDGVLTSVTKEAWQQQSEFMVDEIDRLLRTSQVSPKSVEAIAVTKGPGSYTGVRQNHVLCPERSSVFGQFLAG